jgi:hypothetical protein
MAQRGGHAGEEGEAIDGLFLEQGSVVLKPQRAQ